MRVCVYCGTETERYYCSVCNEFDGLVTLEEWEEMENETEDDE